MQIGVISNCHLHLDTISMQCYTTFPCFFLLFCRNLLKKYFFPPLSVSLNYLISIVRNDNICPLFMLLILLFSCLSIISFVIYSLVLSIIMCHIFFSVIHYNILKCVLYYNVSYIIMCPLL